MASHFSLFSGFPLPLFLLFFSLSSDFQSATAKNPNDLVRSSCVHASYPNICLRTLSSYARPANNPRDLAKAAVEVSLCRARKVYGYLPSLRSGSKREQGALLDCVDQLADSVDELSNTLAELKHLRSGTFRWQMSDAQTWVSAALTNEETCLDGFREVDGKVRTSSGMPSGANNCQEDTRMSSSGLNTAKKTQVPPVPWKFLNGTGLPL
ncbi:hypothetical protein F0562_009780 [Nyssa sinensis]|uniref:Pectinesterase inhibitor domain-containing protein n=1 Tax=Nyssa sinensis TaxID=561372 RepID=A0A5J5A201_9ASTE|nr:hypothetical protein F0562_009780 [Nyssa sinensis]